MATKIKILYDPEIFFLQKYGGVSRYFFELLSNFNKDSDIEFVLPLKFSDNYFLRNAAFIKSKNLMRPTKRKSKGRIIKLGLRFVNIIASKVQNYQLNQNKIEFQEVFKKYNFAILHPTYYSTNVLYYLGNEPLVITVYDMIYELFPELFLNDPYPDYKKELIKRADKIIAISNSTKQDLIKIYSVHEDKIEVIHLGCSFQNRKLELRQNDLLPEKYVLFVGARKSYKNFIPFIKSMVSLLKKFKNLKIICAGSKPFNNSEKELFRNLNISDRLIHFPASDDFLLELYKKAILFVFPSLYEGFGIPILEAFSAGCPVACSNTSSLPEVAGDAAIFFNPFDEESISSSIDNLISNQSLRNQMSIRGYERLKAFSWEKTAYRTKKLYLSLV